MSNSSPTYDHQDNPSYVWGENSLNPQTQKSEQSKTRIADAINTQGEAIVNAIKSLGSSSSGGSEPSDNLTQEEIHDLIDLAWNDSDEDGIRDDEQTEIANG